MVFFVLLKPRLNHFLQVNQPVPLILNYFLRSEVRDVASKIEFKDVSEFSFVRIFRIRSEYTSPDREFSSYYLLLGIFWILNVLTRPHYLKNGAILFDIEETIHQYIPRAHNNYSISFFIEQTQIGSILFGHPDVRYQRIVSFSVVRIAVSSHYREWIIIIRVLSSDHFEAFLRNLLFLNKLIIVVSSFPPVGFEPLIENFQQLFSLLKGNLVKSLGIFGIIFDSIFPVYYFLEMEKSLWTIQMVVFGVLYILNFLNPELRLRLIIFAK